LKGDHLRIISAKFGWNWLSSFRGEDFFLISSPPFFSFGPSRDYGMDLCLEVYLWAIYPYFTTFRVTTLSSCLVMFYFMNILF
jgi:hypothetical protein